jgi:hypothetical protein
MNAEQLLPYLGKTDDSDEIRQMLAQLGVARHPKPKQGETDAYVELPRQGMALVFGRPETGKTSVLRFDDVQFFSEDFGSGFDPFPGALPVTLQFADSRDQARAKLGKPAIENDKLDIDIWRFGEHELTLEYVIGGSAIAVLHLSVKAPQD